MSTREDEDSGRIFLPPCIILNTPWALLNLNIPMEAGEVSFHLHQRIVMTLTCSTTAKEK
jgi:hypothetical protein